MYAIFAFKCDSCGQLHEGSPSFAFQAPDPYWSMSETDKQERGVLTPDVCVIRHEEATDYFIRAVLEVPIHGYDEPFLWGLWVSLSEKSYTRYMETYEDPVLGDGFFGWVSNVPSVYPTEHYRAADVYVQLDGRRPKLVLHQSNPETDAFVLDQLHGISPERARLLAEGFMHHG